MTEIPEASRASSERWLAWFEAGNRQDYLYSARAIKDQSPWPVPSSGSLVGTVGPAFARGAYWGRLKWYMQGKDGRYLGLSGWGMHFPGIKNVPWDDVVAVMSDQQSLTQSRAANGHIIKRPPHHVEGWALTPLIAEVSQVYVVVKNRHKYVREYGKAGQYITVIPGTSMGWIELHMEPYLGPEQVVEYLFLLYTLCEARGVTTYHTYGDPHLTALFAQIGELNQGR